MNVEAGESRRERSGTELLVCINRRPNPRQPSCAARGDDQLAERFEQLLGERGLELTVARIYCLGACAQGPNVRLAPGGDFWRGVGLEDVERIIDEISARIAD